ncbi:MAG TPA: BrnT family toxin [Methylocystis sp.]|nr:BrnT family toxin [Methylocystis sp.]
MKNDDFEWDDAKAASNWRAHKITFEMARDVFRDPLIVEWVDEGQGKQELRFAALGSVEGRVLFVAYTMRGDSIRIISAQRAEPWERRKYHNENQT